jgi:riboflavin synthase
VFTGLIQDVGEVAHVAHRARGSRIRIQTGLDLSDAQIGESIAVDGACFTVVELSPASGSGESRSQFSVDVSSESLACTTAGGLAPGNPVHLERALKLSDRLGGHLVLGHVDGVGELKSRTRDDTAVHLRFAAPTEVTSYLIQKGCITVDGVSLTVNQCDSSGFGVTIIPHTADRTRLADLDLGGRVNLEADVIGKYVARLLRPAWGDADRHLEQLLAEQGFGGPSKS